MSGITGLRMTADPARVEEALNSDLQRLTGTAERARYAGRTHAVLRQRGGWRSTRGGRMA